jgi:hypothetical protein
LVNIFVIFVPCHAGEKRNERPDSLAGTVVISAGRAMDHDGVLHALCEAGRVDDSLGDGESNTIGKIEQRSGQA